MTRKGKLLRFSAALLAVLCLTALMPAVPANAIGMGSISVSFSDVPEGSWYHDYVYLCASWGIIDGKEGDKYCPTDSLKRGEFLKLLLGHQRPLVPALLADHERQRRPLGPGYKLHPLRSGAAHYAL